MADAATVAVEVAKAKEEGVTAVAAAEVESLVVAMAEAAVKVHSADHSPHNPCHIYNQPTMILQAHLHKIHWRRTTSGAQCIRWSRSSRRAAQAAC